MAVISGEAKRDEATSVSRVRTDFYDPIIAEIQTINRQLDVYSKTDPHIKTSVDKRSIERFLHTNILDMSTWQGWRNKTFVPKVYTTNLKQPMIRDSTVKTIKAEIQNKNSKNFDTKRRCSEIVREVRMAYDDVIRDNEMVFDWNRQETDSYYTNILSTTQGLGDGIEEMIIECEDQNTKERDSIRNSLDSVNQYITDLHGLLVKSKKGVKTKNPFLVLIVTIVTALKNIGGLIKNGTGFGARLIAIVTLPLSFYLFNNIAKELITSSLGLRLSLVFLFSALFTIAPFVIAWGVFSKRQNIMPYMEFIVMFGFIGALAFLYIVMSIVYATRMGDTGGAYFAAILLPSFQLLLACAAYGWQYSWLKSKAHQP